MKPMNSILKSCVFLTVILVSTGCNKPIKKTIFTNQIHPCSANPSYWQYLNKPILLLGGSSDDNLFQHTSPDLDKELDLLRRSGGNFVRCTMSGRDSGNVYPFYLDPLTRLYDLNRWEDEYWRRFDNFLKATHDRQIIVQIEIWATYDFYTRIGTRWSDGTDSWDRNPFNPARNSNYTTETSGLPVIFKSDGVSLINPFFTTILPRYDETPVVLGFQQKFVDKLLSVSLEYDHVLYCMDNETNAEPEWGIYWAEYVRGKASDRNIDIEVTEMWDTFDPTDGEVKDAVVQNPATHFFTKRSGVSNTLYNPDTYSFLDISNHNAQVGETHFKTGIYVWNKIQESGNIRPVNNVKIYGAGPSGDWNGSSKDGLERFWRNVFAGAAAVRFHRPTAGLGNSEIALSHIKSMRMLTDSIDLFRFAPANELLDDRSDNEAFCLSNNEKEHILYFPAEGSVNLTAKPGKYSLSWLHIGSSAWQEPMETDLPGIIQTPDNDQWAVLVKGISTR